MTSHRKLLIHSLVAFVIVAATLSAGSQVALADDPEFDAITQHLKLHYNAKRISIPFMGLARFFVRIVKPAGVQSVKVAIFEDLNSKAGASDLELRDVMRNALSPEWQSLARVRSRDGEQIYVYGRNDGKSMKLMVVTIDRTDAVVARVKIDPKKLSEFLNNPKILGISINR